jgi:hypothetical protein
MVPPDRATHSAKGNDGSMVTTLALISSRFGFCDMALGLFVLFVIPDELWQAAP